MALSSINGVGAHTARAPLFNPSNYLVILNEKLSIKFYSNSVEQCQYVIPIPNIPVKSGDRTAKERSDVCVVACRLVYRSLVMAIAASSKT